MELSEFLAARLDEEEAEAKGPPGWTLEHWTAVRYADGRRNWRVDAEPRCVVDGVAQEDALFIARYDPARVLAEVAAKRAILADHKHVPASYEVDGQPGFGCVICARNDDGTTAPLGWCQTTRHLGTPHSGHADYDPAWAPEGATP